jgi:hypothetical protein
VSLLGRFWRLKRRQKWLIGRCFVLVFAVRGALWMAAWPRVLELLGRFRSAPGWEAIPPEELAWGIRNAARAVPGASCLTQALALHLALSRAGWTSKVRIGVQIAPESGFGAHAWVERDGKVIPGQRQGPGEYSNIHSVELRG